MTLSLLGNPLCCSSASPWSLRLIHLTERQIVHFTHKIGLQGYRICPGNFFNALAVFVNSFLEGECQNRAQYSKYELSNLLPSPEISIIYIQEIISIIYIQQSDLYMAGFNCLCGTTKLQKSSKHCRPVPQIYLFLLPPPSNPHNLPSTEIILLL